MVPMYDNLHGYRGMSVYIVGQAGYLVSLARPLILWKGLVTVAHSTCSVECRMTSHNANSLTTGMRARVGSTANTFERFNTPVMT